MSSKVLLPKEVAKAIEALRKDGLTDYGIIVRTADAEGYNPNNVNPVAIIKQWLIDTTGGWDAEEEKGTTHLLHALVNGYEVVETPEDKVGEYYHAIADMDNGRTAIKRVLSILNIKIEGVNA